MAKKSSWKIIETGITAPSGMKVQMAKFDSTAIPYWVCENRVLPESKGMSFILRNTGQKVYVLCPCCCYKEMMDDAQQAARKNLNHFS